VVTAIAQGLEDQAPLRRDLQTPLSQDVTEFVDGSHEFDVVANNRS
jgi:hypothetical protein